MSTIQVAIYARVSSERQVDAKTIESQVQELRERVRRDGHLLPEEMQFIDDGYSGSILIRPALERLRDQVVAGAMDRIYVHSPDRLARRYAYQVLLVDEFQRAGVEVIFLNHELGKTPEDDLLLQVQGMVAEYERAKLLERCRRGRRHAARTGAISSLAAAPYGYRYIKKNDGGGQARYEIVMEEAQVVRQIFEWVGKDRLTIREVCQRLRDAGHVTRTGGTRWQPTTIGGILRNPAYVGEAAFGRSRVGPLRPRLRAAHGRHLVPRRGASLYQVPAAEWISVPVPAIISKDAFTAAQEQLSENRRRARLRSREVRYLLQGLIVCGQCGYAYHGTPSKGGSKKKRTYTYYKCSGSDSFRHGGERLCYNPTLRTEVADEAVWREVRRLLEEPEQVAGEYRRRLRPQSKARRDDVAGVEAQVGKLKRGVERLIDGYAEGVIEKGEFEPRVKRLRERIARLEAQAKQLADEESLQRDLRLVIGRLEEFSVKVKEGLDGADWSSRREIIRALVKRVEINPEQINIVFRVPEQSVPQSPEKRFSQDCAGLREVERGGSVGDDFRWWLRDKLQLGYAHQCSFQFSPVTV